MDEKKNPEAKSDLQSVNLVDEQENTASLVSKTEDTAKPLPDRPSVDSPAQQDSSTPETTNISESTSNESSAVASVETQKEVTVASHDDTTEVKPVDSSTAAIATPTLDQSTPVAASLLGATAPTTNSSNRKRLVVWISLGAIVILALVGVIVALTAWNSKADKESTDANIQKASKLGVAVTLVDGQATYVRSGETQPLTTSTKLAEGDEVKTAEAGRVVLTFDDGSALRLDHKSTVTLASLSADDVKVTQSEGTAYSRVVASDRKYTVTVDGVKYQALGTAFATINNETEKGVQVYQSKVKVDGIADAVSEGKQYYKQHKIEALKAKVSDLDLDALASNDFLDWNMTEDEKEAAFKEKLGILKTIREKREQARQAIERPAETTPRQSAGSIQLQGSASDKGAALSWTVTGVEVASGFKLVRSTTTQTPTFGRDDAVYIDKAAARSYTWSTKKAGTYWYRVCAYRPAAGGCVNYSNAVQVTTTSSSYDENKDGEKVTRGSMTLAVDAAGNATWSYTGVAVHGYKLVVSKSQNPTYPDNSIAYFDRYKTSGAVSLSQAGTYYVRICAWTNGTQSEPCVDYSNQVTFIKS